VRLPPRGLAPRTRLRSVRPPERRRCRQLRRVRSAAYSAGDPLRPRHPPSRLICHCTQQEKPVPPTSFRPSRTRRRPGTISRGIFPLCGEGRLEGSVSHFMLPKPRKPPWQTWLTFLNNHLGWLASIDFFAVPTATLRVLCVSLVLVHERRRIVHFNVTSGHLGSTAHHIWPGSRTGV
jgi:hypothetical protein